LEVGFYDPTSSQQTLTKEKAMATKSGTLSQLLSKTMATGSEHIAKALKGEETLPEAAGAAVEDLLSGSPKGSASKAAVRKAVKSKRAAKKKSTAKGDSQRQKSKNPGK
jgi:hypothetical protein